MEESRRQMTERFIYAAVVICCMALFLIVPAVMYRPHLNLLYGLCALHKEYPPAFPFVLAGVCHEQ
jgi:hypothetical protein